MKYIEEKERIAAKSRNEALRLGSKYYIGDLCVEGHILSNGEKMSLRYASCGSCIKCQTNHSCSSKARKAGEIFNQNARHAIEDIMLARELGISVDDL